MPPLDKLSGTLGRENAAHLLRRATFGSTKNDIDTFSGYTVDQAMGILFDDIAMPDPPIDPATSSTWLNPKADSGNSDQEILTEVFMAWHLEQMRNSGTNMRERITFFYHSHLPVRRTLVTASEMLYYQNSLYRHYAFGSFKALFRKICVDNAMLIYLDNGINDKQTPNENFAREMFELYSIGRGEQDGARSYTNYTEDDVVAATRVLTGWQVDKTLAANIDEETGVPLGKLIANGGNPNVANRHDAGIKTFSDKFGGQTIAPAGPLVGGSATIADAEKELDDMIEMIFEQDATAQFILRKLYRHFVYYKIGDDVEKDIIVPLAAKFKDKNIYNYSIPDVLKELLSSEHFFDINSDPAEDNIKASIIKSPIEVVLGTARLFNMEFPADYAAYKKSEEGAEDGLINLLIKQGINFYEPFEVAGFPAYHQFPAYQRNWITPYYMVYRYKTADYMINGDDFEGSSLGITVDLIDWVDKNISDPSDIDTVVSEIMDLMIPYDLATISSERYNELAKILTDNFTNKSEWTTAWNSANKSSLEPHLKTFISKLIQTPEYQLH